MPGAPVALPAGFVTSASDAIGHLEDELQSQTALRREQDKLAAGSAAAARPPTRGSYRALAGQQESRHPDRERDGARCQQRQVPGTLPV